MTTPGKPLAVPQDSGTLQDRLLHWRNRLIADPRFQRWVARFPLTRGIARRKAAAVFDIAAGFVYSQVLGACVELKLLEALRDRRAGTAELARECGLDEEPMRRLLLAADSLGLVQRRGDGFMLGERGAAVLGNPGVTAMVMHNRQLYRDLSDPLALLRGESEPALARFWPYATGIEGDAREYTELMAASQAMVAEDILDAVPLAGHRHLWDIAGGNGTFACHAMTRWPQLRTTVLDLPDVAALARQNFAGRGLGERSRALSGDMFAAPLDDPTPEQFGPADVVSLVRVIHDHDDADVASLLSALRTDMAPGARLVLAEPMAGSRGAEPIGHAYFGLYLFAMGSGRPRSRDELTRMLQDAGFSSCREIATHRPHMVRVLVCEA